MYESPAALRYAQGVYEKRIAMGHQGTTELHDAVCQEAREVILGKRPKPDAAQRQRASGMSSGSRVTSTPDRATINMPKGSDYDKIARAAYPKLEPAQARQKWANTVGKRLLAKQG